MVLINEWIELIINFIKINKLFYRINQKMNQK